MTDAQSRFAIMDEMLQKKINIDLEIEKMAQEISNLELSIKTASADLERKKEIFEEKKTVLRERKNYIDAALKSIEKMSEAEKKKDE